MNENYRIFIPYRDRKKQLEKLLPSLNKKFKNFNYEIKIIEQIDDKPFNLAKLTNIGFSIFLKKEKNFNWTYIFQPVDCYPIEVDYNIYDNDIVYHFDKSYSLDWAKAFCYKPESFIKINGYTNEYWGWGGEDSELILKSKIYSLKCEKRISNFCREDDVDHELTEEFRQSRRDSNLENLRKLNRYNMENFIHEGLNSLYYKLQNTIEINDFTKIYQVNL